MGLVKERRRITKLLSADKNICCLKLRSKLREGQRRLSELLFYISELLFQPCCQQMNLWCLLPTGLLPVVLLLVLLVTKPYGALGRPGEIYQALEAQAHLFSDVWRETPSIVLWVNLL